MEVRVTAAHTAEARAEAGREAGEGGVPAAALSSGAFLGLTAPFSEEGNEAAEARCGPGAGGSARVRAPRGDVSKPPRLSQVPPPTSRPPGSTQRLTGSPFLLPLRLDLAKQMSLAPSKALLSPSSRVPSATAASARAELEAGRPVRRD